MDVRGKVALVVGASSGMGRALALDLASRGATVVATARRAPLLETLASEILTTGGRCSVHQADAQDPATAEQVVRACIVEHGRIDLLILNAGGAPALDMREMQASDVLAYMRSNYDVAVSFLLPVLHRMREQGGGLVLVTNSLAGLMAVPLQGPYSAAKGALKLLIDTCRIEFGMYGIRFTTVYPGFVATQATRNDGMPSTLQVSEARAVRELVRAIQREPLDRAFPWVMARLVGLANALPKRLLVWILRRDLPPNRSTHHVY